MSTRRLDSDVRGKILGAVAINSGPRGPRCDVLVDTPPQRVIDALVRELDATVIEAAVGPGGGAWVLKSSTDVLEVQYDDAYGIRVVPRTASNAEELIERVGVILSRNLTDVSAGPPADGDPSRR